MAFAAEALYRQLADAGRGALLVLGAGHGDGLGGKVPHTGAAFHGGKAAVVIQQRHALAGLLPVEGEDLRVLHDGFGLFRVDLGRGQHAVFLFHGDDAVIGLTDTLLGDDAVVHGFV